MKLYTANMLQQEVSKTATQVALDIPPKLYFDLTPDCNMFCIMCRESIENSGRIMELNLFKRIVDETWPGVMSYAMFYNGESLLLSDFRERLKYIAGHKISAAVVELSTNGMLLSENTSKFLIDNDVEVHISFDGSNAEIFERIRRGSNFNKICRNLERISDIASHMNPFRAPGIGVSIQKDNWHDLVNIVAKANDLGVRRVDMWPVINPERCRLLPDKDVVEKIAEAIHHAEDRGMAVTMYPVRLGEYIWNGDKYVETGDSQFNKTCNAPFICSSISWNGDINLCCNYGDTVESINNKTFYEVWVGKNYQRLRKQVNDPDKMPESCRKCFWVNRY